MSVEGFCYISGVCVSPAHNLQYGLRVPIFVALGLCNRQVVNWSGRSSPKPFSLCILKSCYTRLCRMPSSLTVATHNAEVSTKWWWRVTFQRLSGGAWLLMQQSVNLCPSFSSKEIKLFLPRPKSYHCSLGSCIFLHQYLFLLCFLSSFLCGYSLLHQYRSQNSHCLMWGILDPAGEGSWILFQVRELGVSLHCLDMSTLTCTS